MSQIIFNLKRNVFKALQDKSATDQFMEAYGSMSIDEQYKFYQYFIVDKMPFLKALDATLFPPAPRPIRCFEDNE